MESVISNESSRIGQWGARVPTRHSRKTRRPGNKFYSLFIRVLLVSIIRLSHLFFFASLLVYFHGFSGNISEFPSRETRYSSSCSMDFAAKTSQSSGRTVIPLPPFLQ